MDNVPVLTNDAPSSHVLVVLVHGLGCIEVKPYWSQIPVLCAAQIVPSVDVALWSYPTHIGILDPCLALLRRKGRLAGWEQTGGSLQSFINTLPGALSRDNYRSVFLVGHSQGGMIALWTAHHMLKGGQGAIISGACLASTPTRRNRLAFIHSLVSMGSNTQTATLGNKHEYRIAIEILLPEMVKKIPVFYIRAVNDEILESDQFLNNFTDHTDIGGPHSWPSAVVDVSDVRFQALKNYIVRATQ